MAKRHLEPLDHADIACLAPTLRHNHHSDSNYMGTGSVKRHQLCLEISQSLSSAVSQKALLNTAMLAVTSQQTHTTLNGLCNGHNRVWPSAGAEHVSLAHTTMVSAASVVNGHGRGWRKNGKVPALHKRRGFTLTLSPVTPTKPPCGGFLEFQACHASLCESKTTTTTSSGGYKCPALTSMSQPAMPVSNIGPTRILPFLYLGSQHDALSVDTIEKIGISYILNVSTTSPKPPNIPEEHFLRLPVNDNHSDKLLPLFPQAFQFLDKVKEASGCVLIHCLAGISRSATVAIAYLMYLMNISSDEAYKYVKDKRPTISPNFNFLGQLYEYERQRKGEQSIETPATAETCVSTQTEVLTKKQCTQDLSSPVTPIAPLSRVLPLSAPVRPMEISPLTATAIMLPIGSATRKRPMRPFSFKTGISAVVNPLSVQSPTTALSKLSFSTVSPVTEEPKTPETPRGTTSSEKAPPSRSLQFPQFPTASLDSLTFTPCLAGVATDTQSSDDIESDKMDSKGTESPLSCKPDVSLSIPAFLLGCVSATGSTITSTTEASLQTTTLNNNKPNLASSYCAKSPTAGSKRPLSFSFSLNTGKDTGATSNTQGSGSAGVAGSKDSACSDGKHCSPGSNVAHTPEDVRIRSPEIRAKRPLVRPNSIAFSSYPLFDLPSNSTALTNTSSSSSTKAITVNDRVDVSSQDFTCIQDMDCSGSGSEVHQQESAPISSTAISAPQLVTVEMRVHTTKSSLRGSGLENARKSRSLENLLDSSGSGTGTLSETVSSGSGFNELLQLDTLQQTVMTASELYSPPLTLEATRRRHQQGAVAANSAAAVAAARVALRRTDAHHQSSSSISSSGSHNSLHGSLEIIQVS